MDKNVWKTISLFIRYGLKGEDTLYGNHVNALTWRAIYYCRYILIDNKNNIYFNENINNYITLNKSKKAFHRIEDDSITYNNLFYILVFIKNTH